VRKRSIDVTIFTLQFAIAWSGYISLRARFEAFRVCALACGSVLGLPRVARVPLAVSGVRNRRSQRNQESRRLPRLRSDTSGEHCGHCGH
jgi:hypothetical protein